MISSAVYGGGALAFTAPMSQRPQRSSIVCRTKFTPVVCFHHQNPSGVGDPPDHKTHRLNPVVLNPGNFKFRKSVKEDEEEAEKEDGNQVGFKQMLSFCGLGYWVSGFRCFPWLALNIHMAQNLNMHPSTLQLVQNSGNLPMVAKPLFGMLSDALYIGSAHRIPYVCIGVLLQILAWGPLALVPDAGRTITPLMALVLLSNLGASITEVAKDALVAEYGQKHKITGLQSYAFMASAAGGILGNLVGGFCLLKTEPRTMFLLFSALLSIELIASVTTKETSLGLRKPTDRTQVTSSVLESIRTQFSDFTVAIKDERISRPLIWIAGSIAMIPILSGSIFCYQTQCLHINPSFLGMSKVIGQLLLLSLTVLYDRFLKKLSMRKLVSSLQFAYALALLLDLVLVKQINVKIGIPNEIYVLCVSGLAETIAQFKILPFIVMLASLCPPGCEGSLTSFMASALMLSSIFSGFFGVGLSSVIGITSGDYSSLPTGIVIQALAALVPLLWIGQVPTLQPVAERGRKRGLSKRTRKNRRMRFGLGSTFGYRRERESEFQG
uniref:FBT8 n=1 Tax=Kalanchoe fedtschenkoi TaxID=63787 RepID=A0A7N0V839_KALFE